jgi:hypothetical protein
MFLDAERFLSGHKHRNIHDPVRKSLLELRDELLLMIEYLR